MADLRSYGQVAYEAYCASAGWTSFRGEKLPDWQRQAPEIRTHWEAAAGALDKRIRTDIASATPE